MLHKFSRIPIADNSGGRLGLCIGILRGSKHYTAKIGDSVILAIKKAKVKKKVKSGEIRKGVVIRMTKIFFRINRLGLKFQMNSCILINNLLFPIATRIFGPMPRELRERQYIKILSMAPIIL